jgi:nucleoid-associated protein YgaU
MQQHQHRFRRALSSLVVMLALFVFTPWVLITAARSRFDAANPLADIDPPWRWSLGEIGDVVSEPLRDDAVVNLLIRSSLTIIWLALATVAITIIVEVVHMVRHRGMASPRVRGLGWAQRIARWIAVGIIALLPLNSFGSTATALEQPLGPAATAERFIEPVASTPFGIHPDRVVASNEIPKSFDDEHHPPPLVDEDNDSRTDVVTSAERGWHAVQRGESIYGIAEMYANNDAERTNEIADAILDLNLGALMIDGQRFANPALIQPGWELTLPADVSPPPSTTTTVITTTDDSTTQQQAGPLDRVPDADGFDSTTVDEPTPVRGVPLIDVEANAADAPTESESHITHVVVPGDTLSEIADDHLGDQAEWPEIWEQNAGDDMGAGRTFDDPNLILPGWEIDIPVAAEQRPIEIPDLITPGNTPHQVPGQVPDQVDDEWAPDVETSPAHTPPASNPTAPASSAPASSAPASPAPATTVPTPVGAGDQAGSADWGEPTSQAPSPIRLEHAALLAAGVLTLIGVRRRRALRAALPHARVPTPAPEIAATERRLRTIDPGERAARVDIAVRSIAHQITGTGTQVGTVRIAPDGELIARLTNDARLDAPWVGTQEIGQRKTWTLPASVPIEMLSDDARQAGQPCLALVTVGVDADGRDVLLDLEAAGITAIEATPDQGDEIVRAIGSGLATSLSSEVVHLLVAKLGIDVLFDHPNTRRLERSADAIDAAVQTVGSTLANDRSAFDLRSRRTGGEMWEPAIVLLAHADDAANTLPPLPVVGHGIAAVAAIDPGGFNGIGTGSHQAGARIRGNADGWELVAFDESIELTPIGLSNDDVAEIAAILHDASTPIKVAPLVHVDLDAMAADPLDVIPHDIVVTMMGAVSVVDRDGNEGSFQRSKTVELIAWLATHRERSTRSAARTALWELDVRDATFANVVSEARRALGRLVPPPDDEEWLARTLNESLPLHARVVTDADLIRQRVEHAQVAPPAHAIDVLRPAVEMIHGLPFAGSSYLWPDADGLTSNLVLLSTTAAAELAAHALSMGDTDLVFWATGQGLKVLPGHEELIGLRMRAHARAGDLSGVRQEWESYERVITADSWSDGEPAPKLLDLRQQLLTPAN